MTCFVARSAGHPSNISHFLPHTIMRLCLLCKLEFCHGVSNNCRVYRVLDRITSNLYITLNISLPSIIGCLTAVFLETVARRRDEFST